MTRTLQFKVHAFGLELDAKDGQVIEGHTLRMQSLLMLKNLLMHLQ